MTCGTFTQELSFLSVLLRVGDKWVSFSNDENNDNEMFVRILRHHKYVHLIHVSY